MDNVVGTLWRFSCYIYIYLLTFCHRKTSINFFKIKLTHSPKWQNDVLHDNILIWMPPLYSRYICMCIYIYIYIYNLKSLKQDVCIVRPNWGIHEAWRVFLKLRNNCDRNWKQIESQSSFNKDFGSPKNKEQNF